MVLALHAAMDVPLSVKLTVPVAPEVTVAVIVTDEFANAAADDNVRTVAVE
jgi:hypothetical protein